MPSRPSRPTSARSARALAAASSGVRPPSSAGQLHVLEHGQGRDEVEELEDEAEVVAAEEGPPGGGEAAQARPGHPDLARGGDVDAGDEVEQRALAAAAAAADRDELALGELHGGLAQHVAGLLALAVVLADAVEADDRGARHESRKLTACSRGSSGSGRCCSSRCSSSSASSCSRGSAAPRRCGRPASSSSRRRFSPATPGRTSSSRLSPRRQRDAHLALVGRRARAASAGGPSPGRRRSRRASAAKPAVARRADPGDPRAPGLDDRPAVRRARRHEPAAAGVARAAAARPVALLAVRALERRLARSGSWATRSSSSRGLRADAGLAVVGGVRGLRGGRRVVRCHPEEPSGRATRNPRPAGGSLGTPTRPDVPRDDSTPSLWLALAFFPSVMLGGGDEPPDAGGGGRAVPLDAAARALPAVVHPVLRLAGRGSRGVAGRAGRGRGPAALRPARRAPDERARARGAVVRGPLRLRDGGPRRAGAAGARSRPASRATTS